MCGKALIVCVSVSHGNTSMVARAIGEALDADVREPERVDPRSVGEYDVVGFGSGIYMFSHHPRLRRFVEQLPQGHGTRAFVFATAGLGRAQHLPWQRPLESVLREKGYDVVGSFACRGWDTSAAARLVGGIDEGHPDAADLTRAFRFGRSVAAGPETHGKGRRSLDGGAAAEHAQEIRRGTTEGAGLRGA
jgi:flavodoxin